MSKIITINTLRTTDAANGNRDDAGAPKACIVGGVTRLRHSSQSCKRPERLALHMLNADRYGGLRTKSLEIVAARALAAAGCPEDKIDTLSSLVSETFVGKKKEGAGDKPAKKAKKAKKEEAEEDAEAEAEEDSAVGDKGTTIGFFAPSELAAVATAIKASGWDVKTASDRKALEKAINGIPKAAEYMDAVDIALHGRMFASSPDMNVDAAMYFSHAISTHEATSEVDFFTAVDDLETGRGSAHMGTKEFGSAVMAQTVILNLDQLRHNLPGATADDIKTIVADVIHTVLTSSTPCGNRTTMLSNTLPQFAVVTVSEGVACAASFETPVVAGADGGYLAGSVESLQKEVARINSFQRGALATVVADDAGLHAENIKLVVDHA